MILQVFSVLDKAVLAFLPPFFVRSKGEAIRSFSDACQDKEHQFAKHMTDYVLMYLGEWDDKSGAFVSCEPERVVAAHEVAASE
ncbi:nonstructural protein [Blackfly microvirus SF02]|uniref:Nonstructural protein n=1 Tax=Blackfly microvirus SF02 TaxID=2576452 RepID=A0A4P8PJV5_9VIRU|nr:nonstructural protein [Blackfly microvirus SF02]